MCVHVDESRRDDEPATIEGFVDFAVRKFADGDDAAFLQGDVADGGRVARAVALQGRDRAVDAAAKTRGAAGGDPRAKTRGGAEPGARRALIFNQLLI